MANSRYDPVGHMDLAAAGYRLSWSPRGLIVHPIDYHTRPLGIPWDLVNDLARAAASGPERSNQHSSSKQHGVATESNLSRNVDLRVRAGDEPRSKGKTDVPLEPRVEAGGAGLPVGLDESLKVWEVQQHEDDDRWSYEPTTVDLGNEDNDRWDYGSYQYFAAFRFLLRLRMDEKAARKIALLYDDFLGAFRELRGDYYHKIPLAERDGWNGFKDPINRPSSILPFLGLFSAEARLLGEPPDPEHVVQGARRIAEAVFRTVTVAYESGQGRKPDHS